MRIGNRVKQPEGYTAFIPEKFPQDELRSFPAEILIKAAQAERLIGKLDGITQILPDVDFGLKFDPF